MSRRPSERYVFETAGQWNTCLFLGAERFTRAARAGMRPQAPYTFDAKFLSAPRSRAPAVTPAGEFFWHDDAALLNALADSEAAERNVAPWAITRSPRMVVVRDTLWVAGTAAGTLEGFDPRLLTRQRVIGIEGAEVLDLAADGRNALLILVRRPGAAGPEHVLMQVDCGGRLSQVVKLQEDLRPIQLAVVPEHRGAHSVVFLLDSDQARLHVLQRGEPAPEWTLQLGSLRTCFRADWLASDGRERLLLAGHEHASTGNTPRVLVLDRETTLIDALQLTRPATGIAAGRGLLVVTSAAGAHFHGPATVAGDAAGVSAELLTPLLTAPERAAAVKWQRADIQAALPPGTTLELRYGWIDDAAERDAVRRISADGRLSPSRRLRRIEDRIEHWSPVVSFSGDAQDSGDTLQSSTTHSFPLSDARTTQLWLHVSLRAAPRASLPSLTRMQVSWGSSPLMQQLPAVFRRTAEEPGDFLGKLIGAFEATTGDLDQRIGGLGALVHPDTAPVPWLDEMAEWLGIPWDDALAPDQKRALLRAAARLAAQRGTRAGLATLLECLFPGDPQRFSIRDLDVDFGFASLGSARCRGSRLPAVLAGLPATATVLSRKTILGKAHLPCPGHEPSATAALTGRLRVELRLGAVEQVAAGKWLRSLIDAMVPGHLRVDLRHYPLHDTAFGGSGELLARPQTTLGVDAVTGFARLPHAGSATSST